MVTLQMWMDPVILILSLLLLFMVIYSEYKSQSILKRKGIAQSYKEETKAKT